MASLSSFCPMKTSLHAVSVMFIPVVAESWILLHELFQFLFRHGGIPLACIPQSYLSPSLLKYIAGVRLIAEVADSLASYDGLGPLACDKLVEAP